MAFKSYRFKDGGAVPTYTALAQIVAGQIVEGGTNGVQPTSGASFRCLGVATTDAAAPGVGDSVLTYDAFGNTVTDVTGPPNTVTVDTGGVYSLTSVAAVLFGQRIKSAAAGQVTLWVQGTDDPSYIIGRCVDQAGCAAAGSALFKLVV